MRKLVGIFLILFANSALAASVDGVVKQIKSGSLDLNAISNLVVLDKQANRIGYGLCKAAKRLDCVQIGTLGYGLCMVAGRNDCIPSASLGYGICTLSDRKDCIPNGSLGYGLCMNAGNNDCIPN